MLALSDIERLMYKIHMYLLINNSMATTERERERENIKRLVTNTNERAHHTQNVTCTHIQKERKRRCERVACNVIIIAIGMSYRWKKKAFRPAHRDNHGKGSDNRSPFHLEVISTLALSIQCSFNVQFRIVMQPMAHRKPFG